MSDNDKFLFQDRRKENHHGLTEIVEKLTRNYDTKSNEEEVKRAAR
jgi:hypothetical protein